MSTKNREKVIRQFHRQAPLFSALGDSSRIDLLMKLSDGKLHSITELTEGTSVSRQAVTKHLRILEDASLIRGIRKGRESLFRIEPRSLDEAKYTLDEISRQWDQALSRLKAFVEE